MDEPERPDLLGYSNEKLGEAVQVLATHPANVKLRLKAAAKHLLQAQPRGLPPRLRKEYEAIWHELTKNRSERADIVGRLSATLYRKRLATCSKLAMRIYSLSSQVDCLIQVRRESGRL